MEYQNKDDVSRIYAKRFSNSAAYRNKVWQVLCNDFFSQWIFNHHTVLDLGCGYGEFINNIQCYEKYALDLNPESSKNLTTDIILLNQYSNKPWNIENDKLDIVFTSNFFEHLPDKKSLSDTLVIAKNKLKQNGILIAMGPNIHYLKGEYWSYWDHYLPLTHSSLAEGLELSGFKIEKIIPKFLPYTMERSFKPPIGFIKLYLNLPLIWNVFGKQFLVIAKKK